ncbi:hypothetical protein OJAV_G00053260 [Oryzias javanicus]|uniref:Uncharacterized protein n=1 Tax=Oryzias javanicus TaxID=123683 RepID=A0A437D8S9_ORYJA|nr:hypothetical protein OJAV_G00053260 [Oryzias javanicus]
MEPHMDAPFEASITRLRFTNKVGSTRKEHTLDKQGATKADVKAVIFAALSCLQNFPFLRRKRSILETSSKQPSAIIASSCYFSAVHQ